MHSKKIMVVIIIILSLIVVNDYKQLNKKDITEESSSVNEKIDSYSVLSIMIENDSGEYEISKESSWPSDGYVFNDVLSKCENGSQISYNKDTKKVQLKSNKSDRCYVYFDMMALFKTCSNVTNLSTCLKNYYNAYGSEINMYLHDATLTNGAGDGSYRYAGADPNNYICFGTTTSPCPEDNLYRIIGVFDDKVKLIKYDYATSDLLGIDGDYGSTGTPNASYYKGSQTTIAGYYWNASTANGGTENNNWNESRLNTINLNTNFINNIGTTWTNKIEETSWNIGGYTTEYATAKTFYDAEKTDTYKAKIGLMTVSEYGYATLPDNWTKNLSDYSEYVVKDNNWMYMGNYDWTITRSSSSSYNVFIISYTAWANAMCAYADSVFGVRPSFSLKSSITYVDGSGSKIDPIRIVNTSSCFTEETQVQTKDGYSNIKDIKIGDKVYSYNEKTKQIELNEVEKIIESKSDHINIIKVGKEIIKVTDTHPMFSKTKYESDGSYKQVSELKEGDYLYNEYGEYEEIKEIERKEEETTVYNLTVKGNHNYFVTKDNYLVHNKLATGD